LPTRVYGKIDLGIPTLVHTSRLVLVTLLTLSGSVLLPRGVTAQQLVASSSAASTQPAPPTPASSSSAQPLPDAPDPQQTSTPAPAPQPAPDTQTPEDRKAKAAAELKAEESQRIAGIIPNFNAVNSGKAEPITPAQKFHLFFKGSVDIYQFVLAGLDAGIGQAENTNPGYNQGLKGFARRYGANYGDNFDGNFWGNAVLPSLLHQDPRYFRLGHGSFVHRSLYSISTSLRTRGDNGKWEPNVSNLTGNLIGASISNVYYPDGDRGLYPTLRRALSVTDQGAIGALLEEFYPDVEQYFKKRHAQKKAAAQP
jgi:hypothetical protein